MTGDSLKHLGDRVLWEFTGGTQMARLIAVLGCEVSEWPEGIDHFFCDPDGEVRGSPDTRGDFYPNTPVDDIDRGEEFGDETIRVTEADWKEFRLASGIK